MKKYTLTLIIIACMQFFKAGAAAHQTNLTKKELAACLSKDSTRLTANEQAFLNCMYTGTFNSIGYWIRLLEEHEKEESSKVVAYAKSIEAYNTASLAQRAQYSLSNSNTQNATANPAQH